MQHVIPPTPDQRWTDALRRGDFERAWQLSDASLHDYVTSGASKHVGPRHLQRIWRGESLTDKRMLVRCYHGLGDTVQFARFAKPLRGIASEVIFWAQPELVEMLRDVEGIDDVIPLHDGAPCITYDVDIEVMELAHALRATPAVIAERVPYLGGNIVAHRRESQFTVGLVWEAGNWDRRRCVPWQMLAALSAVPGVKLMSLQQGPSRNAAEKIPAEDIATADIKELAATILGMDLLISVDTMVAHLAGALGAPVWTMLHADCDWRWPVNDRQTPWYPTMTLFHQNTPGDWTSVIAEITRELQTRAAGAK